MARSFTRLAKYLRIEFPPGSRRKEGVCFSAAQLGLDAGLIEFYRKQQPTISEHQQTIAGYLRLRPFDDAEAAQLEQFLFEESCRLEQAAALMGRAREFLKEQRIIVGAGDHLTTIGCDYQSADRGVICLPLADSLRDVLRLAGLTQSPCVQRATTT